MKNHFTIQEIPQNCISWYLKALFQTQNDLRYALFNDIPAPSSRTKYKAEIRNQKAHNENI